MGFLLATRPASLFTALYRDAGSAWTADDFAASFARAYGESLDDVWAEMIAAGRPLVFCPWECSRPPAPLDGVTPVAKSTTCGVPAIYKVALAEPSELVATLPAASDLPIGLCGAGTVPATMFFTFAGTGTMYVDHVLGAGDYFVTRSNSDGMATLARHPQGTFITSGCNAAAQAPPWRDIGSGGSVVVMVPPGTWHIGLSWSTLGEIAILPNPAVSSSFCPTCDATDDMCTTASLANTRVQGERTWRVVSPPVAGRDLNGLTLFVR